MLGRKYVPYTPEKGKFTKNDTLMELKDHSLVMRVMYWNVKKRISKQAKPGTPEYRMHLESSVGAPLRNMQISGGAQESFIKGLLAVANGRFLYGLRLLLKRK